MGALGAADAAARRGWPVAFTRSIQMPAKFSTSLARTVADRPGAWRNVAAAVLDALRFCHAM